MDLDLAQNLELSKITLEIVLEVLIVLGIGIVIGLEREYSINAKKEEGDDSSSELFAGVRTFPVVAIIGYLSVFMSKAHNPWIYPATLLVVSAFAVLSYYLANQKRESGSTTQFALIVVFLLSGVVYYNEYLFAAFLGLLVAGLLALKVRIHTAVAKLSKADILSILLFAAISVLVLPVLPNRDFGPYGALNPYKIWLIVTIFMSINFVGYFLHKFIKTKYSILLTGILGGFVSSTATAWYFSRLGGKSEKGGAAHLGAIVLASSIMFPRILIWLFLLNTNLLKELWIPLSFFGIIGFVVGLYLSLRLSKNEDISERPIDNPINLKDALVFATIYVLILLVVGFAGDELGERGVYFASAISGLSNVDAITISMANYTGASISMATGSIAILLAAFANTLVKYSLCMAFGNSLIRKYATLTFGPLFLLGVAYIIFLFW